MDEINPVSRKIFFAKSTDAGPTFSLPVNISKNEGFSNEPINVIDILYETSIIVIDNNNVYISWTDGTLGSWEILLTTSINGGETFDKPKTLVTILVNHGNQTLLYCNSL
jgi:hypothetical protein